MKERIQWIDIMKGICILAVMAGHFGFPLVDQFVFSFHILCFFVLSGYTMRITEFRTRDLSKRFVSLMRPYAMTCLAMFGIDALKTIVLNHNISIQSLTELFGKTFIISLYMSGSRVSYLGFHEIGRIGAIWFFPALFFAWLAAQIIIKKFPTWKSRFFVSLILYLITLYSATVVYLPFSIQSGTMGALFVVFGKYLSDKEILQKIKMPHILLFILLSAVGLSCNIAGTSFARVDPTYWFSPIFGICIFFLLYRLSTYIHSRSLIWIGKNSLYILCFHLLLLEHLGFLFHKINHLVFQANPISYMVIQILSAIVVAYVFVGLKERGWLEKNQSNYQQMPGTERDTSVDVLKGILLILMIVGHKPVSDFVDPLFRTILYSVHLPAFVLLSGYFYRPVPIKRSVHKVVKSFLVPYAIYAMMIALFLDPDFRLSIIKSLFGMSFSKLILTDIPSVGAIWFLLLLAGIRITYSIIDHLITDKRWIPVVLLGVSGVSVFLGRKGYWLPWSYDVSLFGLWFYYAGHLIHQYKIRETIKEKPYISFFLILLWLGFIRKGGLELAMRNYGAVALFSVAAAVSATVLLMAATDLMPKQNILIQSIAHVGNCSLFILMVHTRLATMLPDSIAKPFNLYVGNIPYLVISIAIQVLLGILIYHLYEVIRRKLFMEKQ
ncbi:MAG: acyltransferase family protein [Erysipelotrichaceae bacterium]|nr:acyltransferase family protein [Erysipelotrichaceae bacterium]